MNHLRVARPLNPKISIIVPAMNEAENLRHILPLLPPVHEVILVDGFIHDFGSLQVALTSTVAFLACLSGN